MHKLAPIVLRLSYATIYDHLRINRSVRLVLTN